MQTNRTCEACRREFEQHTMWQRFCSNRCRLREWCKVYRPKKAVKAAQNSPKLHPQEPS